MAHNAAFEDSWFMLHIDGYAEARKEGKIVPIDTREICRRLDPEFRSLLSPHQDLQVLKTGHADVERLRLMRSSSTLVLTMLIL